MRDIGKVSAAAFRNAVRLHKDSVLLHGDGRFPSAFQLSVLSQEEVGKTFLLEEFAFRVGIEERDPQDTGQLLADLLSHTSKQLWFTKQEWDLWDLSSSLDPLSTRGKTRISRLLDDARTGRLEMLKQDAAYVGLTRNRKGKLDPNGRLMTPALRIRKSHATTQITRVSDVLVWLTEMSVRGILMMDTDELTACMTRKVANDLQALWPQRGRSLERALARVGA